MTAKPTPGPWSWMLENEITEREKIAITANDGRVCRLSRVNAIGYNADTFKDRSAAEVKANAEYIVRACNSHQELLLACKKAESTLIEIKEFLSVLGASYLTDGALQFLSSSISKAEGRS